MQPITNPSLWLKCARVILFVLYVLYFHLANQILSVFQCYKEETIGKSWMQNRPYIECGSGDWNELAVIAACFVVIYIVGIPVLLAVLLFRSSIKNDAKVHYLVQQFSNSYRKEMFWFELIVTFRRLAIAIAFSLLPKTNPFSGFLVLTFLTLSIWITSFLNPFAIEWTNRLDIICNSTILLTFGAKLLYSNAKENWHASLFIVVVIINSLTILFSVFCFVLSLRNSFTTKKNQ